MNRVKKMCRFQMCIPITIGGADTHKHHRAKKRRVPVTLRRSPAGPWFIFVFAVATLASCNPPHAPRDKQTEIFSYYLQNAFNDSIPQQKRTYILVPGKGCKGCRQSELLLLHDALQKKNASHYEYIFSPKIAVPESLVNPVAFRVDQKGLIDEINLPVSNITVIRTQAGTITLLKEISAERMDSLNTYME